MEELVPTEEVAKAEEAVEETPKEEPTETKVEAEPDIEPPLVIPPPKKKTAQERIDEITRARREAEREAEYWRQKALERETPKAQPSKDGLPDRPVISQFDTTEAYEDALLEWNDTCKEIKARKEETKRRNEDALTKFNAKAKPLREQYEDFDEVIETPVFTPAMRAALLQSDNGPEIAYFLGRPENRLTAEKIKSLPVEIQLYELGKLEASLLVAKKTRKVPQAPAPITPVGVGMGGETEPSKMSTAEWMEWDKKRTMERLSKKYGG